MCTIVPAASNHKTHKTAGKSAGEASLELRLRALESQAGPFEWGRKMERPYFGWFKGQGFETHKCGASPLIPWQVYRLILVSAG